MPIVDIDELPDEARVWVFGSDKPIPGEETAVMLGEVDRFLAQWKAHGAPLTAGRSWDLDRFLTVAVDQSTAGASGCSIDGLFRALKALEPRLGASLVTSGLVFFRGADGRIVATERDEFARLASAGKISAQTPVFDPTVTTLGEWRARFALKAGESWHSGLLPDGQPV